MTEEGLPMCENTRRKRRFPIKSLLFLAALAFCWITLRESDERIKREDAQVAEIVRRCHGVRSYHPSFISADCKRALQGR